MSTIIKLLPILFIFFLGFQPEPSLPIKKKKDKNPTDTIRTNVNGQGLELIIEFSKGKKHHHPLIAVWMEDLEGNYLQDLYVAKSPATGIYGHADTVSGKWKKGERRLPAALPYWSHKRGIVAEDGLYMPSPKSAVPDAYTGATPKGNFVLVSKSNNKMKGQFKILLQINQFFDFNRHYTNNKYPNDPNYKTSGQPALVYSTIIDLDSTATEYQFSLSGHSHPSGTNGDLFPVVKELSTALEIVKEIKVKM